MVEAKEKKAKGAVPTAEEKFAKLDTNQDAKLSVEEFEASNPADKEKLAAAFKTADTNADGSLSADEFKTIPSSEDHGKKKKKK